MTSITRRSALLGASAAAAMAATTAPLAIKAAGVKAAGVKAALGGDDPIWAVLARAQSLQDRITAAPDDPATAALETTICDVECEIFETQATTFDGLLAKARYARWIVAPGDPHYRLDGDNLVLSIVCDLERLAGGMQS